MNLQHYDTATSLKASVVELEVFARITGGTRQGSVGKIIDVKSPFFSQHFYRIDITGKRPFWVDGSDLEVLMNYQGETQYVKVEETPTYQDMLGRDISVGNTVSFPRLITGGSVEMIMGTVRRISKGGALYVKPFMISGKQDCDAGEVRIGTPSRAMILDRDTVDEILMAKLRCCN